MDISLELLIICFRLHSIFLWCKPKILVQIGEGIVDQILLVPYSNLYCMLYNLKHPIIFPLITILSTLFFLYLFHISPTLWILALQVFCSWVGFLNGDLQCIIQIGHLNLCSWNYQFDEYIILLNLKSTTVNQMLLEFALRKSL